MKYLFFLSGIMIGIYLDQNYKVPKINTIFERINTEIKKYEKNEKKEK